MTIIYIGTTNPGKLREFANLLTPLGIDTLMPIARNIPETTDSFVGNAREKALAYASETDEITIAEDSGLVIPVISNLPGPWSAMFDDCILEDLKVVGIKESNRPRQEIDIANNHRVLSMMKLVEQPKRAAKFSIHLVVAKKDKILFETTGEAHGWIAEEARGSNGFGYDPIFIGQDTFGKTYAELDSLRKNLRSHRRDVLSRFNGWVASAIQDKIIV